MRAALIAGLAALAIAQPPVGVMNAMPCAPTVAQLISVNTTTGGVDGQVSVREGGHVRCAVTDGCSAVEDAFISTGDCAGKSSACPQGMQFDMVDPKSYKPVQPGAIAVLQSRENRTLCFGIGADLDAAIFNTSAVQGAAVFQMVGAFEALCLSSGATADAYPIALRVCPGK
jgi:hypothetical protein